MFQTTVTIAKSLGVSRLMVDHCVRKFGFREIGRAGPVRIYSDQQAEAIKQAMTLIPRRGRRSVANA